MLSIQLIDLQFYAFHGVHPEERMLGAEYVVNVTVSYSEKKIPVLHLSETIDYTSVYDLVKKHMLEAKPLLETVVTVMAADLFARFSMVEEVTINVVKKHPPLARFQGKVGITYTSGRKA